MHNRLRLSDRYRSFNFYAPAASLRAWRRAARHAAGHPLDAADVRPLADWIRAVLVRDEPAAGEPNTSTGKAVRTHVRLPTALFLRLRQGCPPGRPLARHLQLRLDCAAASFFDAPVEPSGAERNSPQPAHSNRDDEHGKAPASPLPDHDTYDTFFRRQAPAIRSLLSAMSSLSTEDAEDVFQDVFLRCYQRWSSLQSPEHWLKSTARFAALQRIRGRRTEAVRLLDHDFVGAFSPPDKADALDTRVAFSAAVAALRPRCRTLLTWRYRDGQSAAEIAERMQTQVLQIYRALDSCLRALHRSLTPAHRP